MARSEVEGFEIAFHSSLSEPVTIAGVPRMIAVLGDRGCGKTWLACGLVLDFCRAGRSAVYLDTMDYFVELKQTYSDRSRQDESQIETKYLRPELLVLDEIQERGETTWEDRMLVRLINKRYANELSTVLVGNLSKEDFPKHVGSSIKDRLLDGGGVIVCNWPSLRGRIAG